MRRAQAQTITFPAIDSADPPARKTGLTLLNTDVKISKDGGAFVSATNAPAELGTTGRYALVVTAAELDCAWFHLYVEKAGMEPHDTIGSTSDQPSGAVVDAVANSATSFVTDRTESADDYWKGSGVVFTSGALVGQVREVVGYDGTTKAVTLDSALTAEPADGARFLFINL